MRYVYRDVSVPRVRKCPVDRVKEHPESDEMAEAECLRLIAECKGCVTKVMLAEMF